MGSAKRVEKLAHRCAKVTGECLQASPRRGARPTRTRGQRDHEALDQPMRGWLAAVHARAVATHHCSREKRLCRVGVLGTRLILAYMEHSATELGLDTHDPGSRSTTDEFVKKGKDGRATWY